MYYHVLTSMLWSMLVEDLGLSFNSFEGAIPSEIGCLASLGMCICGYVWLLTGSSQCTGLLMVISCSCVLYRTFRHCSKSACHQLHPDRIWETSKSSWVFLLQQSMQPRSFLQLCIAHSHFNLQTFFSLEHLYLLETGIAGTLPNELGSCTSLGTSVIVVSGEHSQTVKLTLPFCAQKNCGWADCVSLEKYRVNWEIWHALVSRWLLVVTRGNHLQIVSRFSFVFVIRLSTRWRLWFQWYYTWSNLFDRESR